jgi:hypothetical protein
MFMMKKYNLFFSDQDEAQGRKPEGNRSVRLSWIARFTLIELLVVTAIIASLLALLLPGLQRAKRYAERAVCASNLRQTNIALFVFTSDHKGHFPWYWRNHPFGIPAIPVGTKESPYPIQSKYDYLGLGKDLYGGTESNRIRIRGQTAQAPADLPGNRKILRTLFDRRQNIRYTDAKSGVSQRDSIKRLFGLERRSLSGTNHVLLQRPARKNVLGQTVHL